MTNKKFKSKTDIPFYLIMGFIAITYVVFIISMMLADMSFTSVNHIIEAFRSPEIQFAIKLSFITCTVSMILSIIFGIPIAYIMAFHDFKGKKIIDAIIDIPIILPPLVIGLSLLIFFQTSVGKFIESYVAITYTTYSIILAQFMVACSFAVRTIYIAFIQIDKRSEQVALTLGANKTQAFFRVLLPQVKRGVFAAASISWARSLGEFGPILVFSGATRNKTEVLSTTVFLELSVGNIEAAVAVSLIMIFAGFTVLILVRYIGDQNSSYS